MHPLYGCNGGEMNRPKHLARCDTSAKQDKLVRPHSSRRDRSVANTSTFQQCSLQIRHMQMQALQMQCTVNQTRSAAKCYTNVSMAIWVDGAKGRETVMTKTCRGMPPAHYTRALPVSEQEMARGSVYCSFRGLKIQVDLNYGRSRCPPGYGHARNIWSTLISSATVHLEPLWPHVEAMAQARGSLRMVM
jgi:hypothetical protein